MSKKITLYFPTNYRHGKIKDSYYQEEIPILSVSPRTSDFINDIFKNTKLYKNLNFLSYKPYIEWNIENDICIAIPKISVFYKGKCLKYFHVPTYNEVKLDFYLLNNSKNDIKYSDDYIIEDNPLVGKYIVSL